MQNTVTFPIVQFLLQVDSQLYGFFFKLNLKIKLYNRYNCIDHD